MNDCSPRQKLIFSRTTGPLSPQILEAKMTVFRNNLTCGQLTPESTNVYLRRANDDIEAEVYNETYLASILSDSGDLPMPTSEAA
jgi:hypothetical protein